MLTFISQSSIFFLVLNYAPGAQAYTLIIESLSFNSGLISFTDWVTLLTLCFAPLVAHIVAGAPEPTIVDSSRPRWHDRAVLLTPTSIIWRYFAIVDRRLRSHRGNWTPQRAAASNALFWTHDGWNGSKDMIISTRRFIAVLPEKPRVKLLSKSSFKSIIVTAQGVQAIWLLVGNFVNAKANESFTLSIDSLFLPLAALGLIRLCAALWLLEDFTYSYKPSPPGASEIYKRLAGKSFNVTEQDFTNQEMYEEEDDDLQVQYRQLTTHQQTGSVGNHHLLAAHANCGEKTQLQSQSRLWLLSDLDHTGSWSSRILRLLTLCVIMLLWMMCLFNLGVGRGYTSHNLTVSLFLADLWYMFWLIGTAIIFLYYFVRGDINSTIIPCISSAWYKLYSAFMMLTTIVLIVIVAIETQQLPCGRTSTWPFPGTSLAAYCPGFEVLNSDANLTSIPLGVVTWSW